MKCQKLQNSTKVIYWDHQDFLEEVPKPEKPMRAAMSWSTLPPPNSSNDVDDDDDLSWKRSKTN